MRKKVDAQFEANIRVIQQVFEQPSVSADGNAFERVVEVMVVAGSADRQCGE